MLTRRHEANKVPLPAGLEVLLQSTHMELPVHEEVPDRICKCATHRPKLWQLAAGDEPADEQHTLWNSQQTARMALSVDNTQRLYYKATIVVADLREQEGCSTAQLETV